MDNLSKGLEIIDTTPMTIVNEIHILIDKVKSLEEKIDELEDNMDRLEGMNHRKSLFIELLTKRVENLEIDFDLTRSNYIGTEKQRIISKALIKK